MQDIRSWTVSVSVMLVCVAVLKFVIPSGNMKKFSAAVMTLALFAFMLSTAVKLNTQLSFESFGLSGQETDEAEDPYSDVIARTVKEMLSENGIPVRYVRANAKLNDNGIIEIYSVEIAPVNVGDSDKARELTENGLSLPGEAVTISE